MSQRADTPAERLRVARDFLLTHRLDYAAAYAGFRWPILQEFNFAADWFDEIAHRSGERSALRVVSADKTEDLSFSELARRSHEVAHFLADMGVRRGDAVILMLENVPALWETMLAAIRMGALIIPCTTLLSENDVRDRITRSDARVVITTRDCANRLSGAFEGMIRVCVGDAPPGWRAYSASSAASASQFTLTTPTRADEPMLLYFTSGTTAKAKLVMHSHASYPVGHLSTLYWLGLQPGDIHLNISSPGWAKHAWSSLFAPWLAEATVLAINLPRFDAAMTLDILAREKVTSFCAPPTVWRMLIQQPLGRWRIGLREAASAGEPLNPEVIDHVRRAYGVTIRDGYGQTETTALIGNPPGREVAPGAMGVALPGYAITLRNPDGLPSQEGQVCIELGGKRPLGLMSGYKAADSVESLAGPFYGTGDTATQDDHGRFVFVGRADDVFKASDYRISPFELESVLLEHPSVAEAAVVPSPDPMRLAVPKAFVALTSGVSADSETARSILDYARKTLGPFKRIRRIEFYALPKTISGKIRRVDLRRLEAERRASGARGALEWTDDDFS